MAPQSLECPHCGKVGRSPKNLATGQGVRCSGCGEAFKVPEPSVLVATERPSAILEITQEPEGTANDWPEPTIAPAEKPKRSGWVGKALTTCALIGLGFGGGFLVGGRTKTTVPPAPAPGIPDPQVEFDRIVNPFRIASLIWKESEHEITIKCMDINETMIKMNKPIDANTFAFLLESCGNAERAWRGPEKCEGMAFTLLLFAEMVSEGTPAEDAARMIVKVHRLKPNGRQGITATECFQSRMTVHKMVKMGAFPTRAMAYDQLLKTANLVDGNANFDYK